MMSSVGLGNSMIVIHYHDSWSTIIVLFNIVIAVDMVLNRFCLLLMMVSSDVQ